MTSNPNQTGNIFHPRNPKPGDGGNRSPGGAANRADTDEGNEVERAGAGGAAARHKT